MRSYTPGLGAPRFSLAQSSPLPTATLQSWELVAPLQSQGCGSDLALPQFQRLQACGTKLHARLGKEGGGVGESRAAHPPKGASKAPGAWQTQRSGPAPEALRLRKPDRQVLVSLNPHIQEPPQRAQCFLLLAGSRPDRKSGKGGPRQKPRSVSRLLQPPRPSDPRLPRREATLPPAKERPLPKGGWIRLQLWIK